LPVSPTQVMYHSQFWQFARALKGTIRKKIRYNFILHLFNIQKNHITAIKPFTSPKLSNVSANNLKIEIVSSPVYRDRKKQCDEKNRRLKISWHCPFRNCPLKYKLRDDSVN
jgi:hypothetical protein